MTFSVLHCDAASLVHFCTTRASAPEPPLYSFAFLISKSDRSTWSPTLLRWGDACWKVLQTRLTKCVRSAAQSSYSFSISHPTHWIYLILLTGAISASCRKSFLSAACFDNSRCLS